MKIKKEIQKWKNFMIANIALAIFFGLEYFHEWANGLLVKLHFCDHTYCMIFAAIFVIIAFFTWKNKKHYLKSALIILGVGLILMNVTYCENGNMFFGDFSFGTFSIIPSEADECKPGVDCPGDIVEVPIPPCVETDDGRDYITFGSILSGADLDDLCMGNVLRERYCNSETTYTSKDIDCPARYGDTWICEEGECRDTAGDGDGNGIEYGEENTKELCMDGIDNDGDGKIDCADPDCSDEFCDCSHGSVVIPPDCAGRCETGTCEEYLTWCECVPDGEIPCGESTPDKIGIDCDGWCLEGDYCIHNPEEVFEEDCCYCSPWYCVDTDGGYEPLIQGIIFWEDMIGDYCDGDGNLVELVCSELGPFESTPLDCDIYGEYYRCIWGEYSAYCGVET